MLKDRCSWDEALPKEADIVRVYKAFEGKVFNALQQFTTLISRLAAAVHALRADRVKIGTMTGYIMEMIDIVKVDAAEKEDASDCSVIADEVSAHGRTASFIIYENLKSLEVMDVRSVVKVGDTKADIEEGL